MGWEQVCHTERTRSIPLLDKRVTEQNKVNRHEVYVQVDGQIYPWRPWL